MSVVFGLPSIGESSWGQKILDSINAVKGTADGAQASLTAHVADSANPHAVTKAQVGLGNVDNTSDANKPVSTATQTALNSKVPKWAPSTAYATGDPVLAPDGSLVKAKAAFTSGASYSAANWTTVNTYAGTQAKTELDAAYVSKGALVLNVKDYGAVGDGTTDDRAAIQAAHDALPANGGGLYFPAGTYKVGAAITVTKSCLIFGTGYGSNIKTSSATANVFTVSAQFVGMRDINITSSVTRTGGWYVDVLASASRFRIEDFFMDGAIGGLRTAASATCTVDHGTILNGTAATGVAVRIDGGVDISINDLLVDAGAQTYAGIYIANAGDVQITESQIIHAGDGLHVEPGAGAVVASVWSSNTFYDTCTNGVVLNAAGGSIVRSRFTSCWMSSATAWGVRLLSSAGGSIDGTDILGCHVFANGSGGIVLTDTGVRNTRIAHCAITGNTANAGILVNAAVQDFSIIGNNIGDGYGFAGNGYGIYFNSTSATYFQVSGNDLTGNTVAAISGAPTAGANRIISGNLGDPTSGTVAGVTVTASPFTYTAGPRAETVCINGGTVSLVTVDGTAVFQQTNCTVRLAPGKSVQITYTVAPGVAAIRD